MDESQARVLQAQLKALQRRQRRESPPPPGLARSSTAVLGAVARRPEGCQPGQVADELVMTTSNVAAALRELEDAGLVVRRREETDSRRVQVSLTPEGAALVAATRHGRDSWLVAAAEELLDEREQATLLEAGHLIERLAGAGPHR